MKDKKDGFIKVEFSDRLKDILRKLEDENNYIAFELMWMSDTDHKYHNNLMISKVDIGSNDSSSDFEFVVTIGNKEHNMKIGKFIRYFFPKIFEAEEIASFIRLFNKSKNGESVKDMIGSEIEVPKFSFNPKDPRSTFLSMVTKTYPYGHEEEVLQFLPKGLEMDKHGNYFKIISGDDTTMFTSHLDTADRKQNTTKLYSKKEGDDEIIYTDGNTILGADDKSGVTVMLYMMAHNIPGIYYFFIGEERGGIGSGDLAQNYEKYEFLENVNKCISFDRRRNTSVITHQLGGRCCSNEFGTAICEEFNKQGLNLSLDSGGIYTDSASFMEIIPECTNLSVGYLNEHTGKEEQNMTFLIQLCETSINVNWKDLPVARKVGMNKELIKKHSKLIDIIKKYYFELDVRMVGHDDRIFIRVDLESGDINEIHSNLINIQDILNKHRVDGVVYFDEVYIKIELT